MSEQIDPEAELLRSGGLSSLVYSESRDDGHGHVLMLDYDDVDDVFRVISEVSGVPGVSVLLESSDGSYHGYNLSVRPFEAQITDAARKNGEMSHVRSSARRGYFVLRWTAKLYESDGSVYKPSPKLIDVYVSESDLPQSKPHLQLFYRQAVENGQEGIAETLQDALGEFETVGSSVDIDRYQTGTDRLKGRVAE